VDDLGNRMKAHEAATVHVVDPDSWVVVRLDGRAFHTYTRGLGRPFDDRLSHDLDTAAGVLCADVDGARFAYLQSDECSVVVPPRSRHAGEHWFGGKTQKIASVSASLFTAVFNRERGGDVAQFDARVFSLPDAAEVRAYLCWRQADARRNAVTMVAQTHFSHRQLHGIPSVRRRQMLADAGVDLDTFDPRHMAGRVVSRETYVGDVEYVDGRTGETRTAAGVTRSRWVAEPAPVFRDLADLSTLAATA
jgi:tRNA(His) guanylyltransferase